MVYYNDIEKHSILGICISHLLGSSIAVAVWVFKSSLLVEFLIEPSSRYNEIIHNFLYLRIIQGYLGYIICVLFYYMLLFYQNNIENKKKEESFKILLRDAELKSLKSQINPHFLFNSLNSISSLTMFDAEKAQTMIIKLSDYLRFSLQFKPNDLVSFEKEIENIQRYLDIEKIRFGKRLNINFSLSPECMATKVPTMILQPLFENAIKYGVHENIGETIINVWAKKTAQYTKFVISNNYDSESVGSKGQGIGISNIKDRMFLLYGSHELVQINNLNDIFTVTILFPESNQTSLYL